MPSHTLKERKKNSKTRLRGKKKTRFGTEPHDKFKGMDRFRVTKASEQDRTTRKGEPTKSELVRQKGNREKRKLLMEGSRLRESQPGKGLVN